LTPALIKGTDNVLFKGGGKETIPRRFASAGTTAQKPSNIGGQVKVSELAMAAVLLLCPHEKKARFGKRPRKNGTIKEGGRA